MVDVFSVSTLGSSPILSQLHDAAMRFKNQLKH